MSFASPQDPRHGATFQRVFSFAHKSLFSPTVQGVVTRLDLTIYEACVLVPETGHEVCVTLDPQDCTEPLLGLIRGGGDAFRVECESDHLKRCVQLHLMVCPDRVDHHLREGTLPAEEHVINLARMVWREARVPVDRRACQKGEGEVDETPFLEPDSWSAEHPLYVHQRRTATWIQRIESGLPCTVRYAGNLRITSEWFVDTESECFTTDESPREAHLAGGICADGTGAGKTATLLSVVAATASSGERPGRPYETRGTLVIVPLNLVSQWQHEIRKFLRPQGLKVQFLVQGKEIRSLSMEQLCDADLTVTTFHFLRASKAYTELVESALEGRARTRPVLSSWARQPGRTEPILEAVLWRRVVVDELHETFESPRDLRQLKLFRFAALWGLTATPALDTEQAQHLYLFLRREKAHHPNLLARLIELGVRESPQSPSSPPPLLSLRKVHLSAEERVKLSSCCDENDVAGIVRRCTFVDPTSDPSVRTARREMLRAKLEGHERSVRVMEGTATELENELEHLLRQCAPGAEHDAELLTRIASTRRASETHAKDLSSARMCRDADLLRLERLDASERQMHERLTMLVTETCPHCTVRKSDVLMRCCARMCCAVCATGCTACPLCAMPGSHDAMVHVPVLNGVNTKMTTIAELIARLGEPVILVVQWKSMMRVIRTFLTSLAVRVLLLDGNAAQRAATLVEFLSSGVLLLCLEDSFAGLHLPHVRHVIFAHAIVGDRRQVERLERQAIARCVRHGQTEQVHVYSFVITESEEERLWHRTHDVDAALHGGHKASRQGHAEGGGGLQL